MTRRPVSALWIVLAASGWMAAFGNGALWQRLAALGLLDGPRGWAFAAGMGLMIAALLTTLLSLLAWRFTLKPAVSALLLATALASHFMLSYGVVVDPGMMVNALQTDVHEAGGLLDLRLLLSVVLLALLPMGLLWRQPVAYGSAGRQLARNALLLVLPLFVFAGTLMASFQALAAVMRSHTEMRYLINPLNTVYALGRIAAGPLQRGHGPLEAIGQDAHLRPDRPVETARPPLLVLVVGETARSGNFSLNGYARPTTPELARQRVASMRNAWSCGTSTAASLPCMFSHLGRVRFNERTHDAENLLDVLQRAGLAVLWLDNQAGCKGVCERVPHASTCPQGECLDEVMLQGLDGRLQALDPARRAQGTVLVLHQMGSHGPAYHLRSPAAFKRFVPECATASLQDCPREQVVNAYDNTIAYTDHFLALTIAWLERHEADARTALVYVADHGESLGEHNIYLHGLPYRVAPDEQKRVPWITWLSPAWESATGLSTACLQQRADAARSHDHYFHSVTGLMDVASSAYRLELDAYADCRRAPAGRGDSARSPVPQPFSASRSPG